MKYFPGFLAIIFAITFSAFTKPFSDHQFKLLTDPQSPNIVNDNAQWSTGGNTFGNCNFTTPVDIACKILLNTAQTTYFHTSGWDQVLNTFAYSSLHGQEHDYLEITETTGKEVSPGVFDRKISSINARHFNGIGWVYVQLGSDLSFTNARD